MKAASASPPVNKTVIARAAGVSRTCVSQVLNDRPNARIGAQTRRRIFEIAREMGYCSPPSPPAATTRLIAYVLGHDLTRGFQSPWHFHVLTHLQQRAAAHERCITFMFTNSADPDALRQTLHGLELCRPLGVVFDGVVPPTLVEEVLSRKLPSVIAGVTPYAHDSHWAGRCNTVSMNIGECVRQLMRYLHGRGVRSIALVTYPFYFLIDNLILGAYRRCAVELNLRYDPALIQVCSDVRGGAHILARYHELGIHFDAMLFTSATLAAAVFPSGRAVDAAGHPLRLPLGIVGSPDVERDVLPEAAMAGLDCGQFTGAVYDLLAAQINYLKRPPEHRMASTSFREPTGALKRGRGPNA